MIVREPTAALKSAPPDALLGLFSLVVLWMNDLAATVRVAPQATL